MNARYAHAIASLGSVPLLVPKWPVSGFDAQMLEHAHVEIAEGRRVSPVEMEVLAVLEAAAGVKDGQIFRGVAAGVAAVAVEENGGATGRVESYPPGPQRPASQ